MQSSAVKNMTHDCMRQRNKILKAFFHPLIFFGHVYGTCISPACFDIINRNRVLKKTPFVRHKCIKCIVLCFGKALNEI